jgi:hypothetical protein
MGVRAPTTWARTVGAEETIWATGRFRVGTHRGARVPSVAHRAGPVHAPAVPGVLPAWEVPVAEADVRAADVGGNQAMKKENGMNFTKMNPTASKFLSTMFVLVAYSILATAPHATPQTKTAASVAPAPERTFDTAQQAADVMIAAVKNDDVSALQAIFGPDGKDFVSSGDDVQDKTSRARFAAMAAEKMDVEVDRHNANRAIVSVGNEDWPLPVPIVKLGGKWHFDSKAGRKEILDRHIGENELDAIQICRGYDDAQKEYAEKIHDDSGVHQYAQRLISLPGKQDGLAWQNADGSWGGPVGDAIAKDLEEGNAEKGKPFHGYYFKVLKGQGPAATLGQLDYVIEGAMIGGFALVAVPANYRVTGVMTFMVSYDGVVYQKDLGPDSINIVKKMELYNPDKTWQRTDDEE